MRRRLFPRAAELFLVAAIAGLALQIQGPSRAAAPQGLSSPRAIATGVDLFTSTDATLVDDAGPISIFLLRLDPSRVKLSVALAHDALLELETVDQIATRAHAIAAINGSLFSAANNEPIGVLKIGREIVSDSATPKGAVAIAAPAKGKTSLAFDQIALRMRLTYRAGGRSITVPIDGVDTTRARDKLMLFTPRYRSATDTPPTGTEWSIDGDPPRVTAVRPSQGHTPIPRTGGVLSFGGTTLPEALAALQAGTSIALTSAWTTEQGLSPAALDAADAIVAGAGLLRAHGKPLAQWDATEGVSVDAFINARHPRTIIGVDGRGQIWLGVIDGRKPNYSIGMTFADLERLCARLDLRDALNLDGGSSTSMVAEGKFVNHPGDLAGPHGVSNAIVVTLR
jgi:hypothetical protein